MKQKETLFFTHKIRKKSCWLNILAPKFLKIHTHIVTHCSINDEFNVKFFILFKTETN